MSKFYYINDVTKQQCGPFEPERLQQLGIRRETMVWQSGMPDWMKAEDVEALSFLFDPKSSVPRPEKVEPIEINEPDLSRPINLDSGFKLEQMEGQDSIPPMPKNWMTESVVLSILCCSPISVVGIYNASKVEKLYSEGRYAESLRTSDLARNWALLGILFLPVCYMIFFFFNMLAISLG